MAAFLRLQCARSYRERTPVLRPAFSKFHRLARKPTALAPLYRALEQRFAGRDAWGIYDIGANDAGIGIACARAFQNCRVELFEAHPEVAHIARKRLAAAGLDHRARLHEFAASNADGAELMVLEGLGLALEHVEAIWLEVERVELYKGQPLVDDVRRFPDQYGFELAIDAVSDSFDNQLWFWGA